MLASGVGLYSQNVNKQIFPERKSVNRVELELPQVDGYTLLRCDFHSHTIFSDGLVWPTYRVMEAWKTGLDVLAITDHIEYRPYKEFTNGDLNTSYNIALPVAKEMGVMLVKGVEITRKQGIYGHFNALFIQDVNPIDTPDPEMAIKIAYDQGAFITYNHPAWALDTCLLTDFQTAMIDKGYVHGIEVFNNDEFYPRALSWSQDKKLTVFAGSDVHAVIVDNNGVHGSASATSNFRPMTLVFVKEKSAEAVKDALLNRRTLAYFSDNVAGEEQLLKKLFLASVQFVKVSSNNKQNFYKFSNNSGIPYVFSIGSMKYTLDAKSHILVGIPLESKNVDFVIHNMHCYENRQLKLSVNFL